MSVTNDIIDILSRKTYIYLNGPDKRCCVEAFKKLKQLKDCDLEFVAVNRFIRFSKTSYEITFYVHKSKAVLTVPTAFFSISDEPIDAEEIKTLDAEARITARVAEVVWDFYKNTINSFPVRKDKENFKFNSYSVSLENGDQIYGSFQ